MIRMLVRVGILFHFVDDSVLRHIKLPFFLNCTIGRTSRATFGIPAKHLNITIYPIPGEFLF